jgi:hypothetical protein
VEHFSKPWAGFGQRHAENSEGCARKVNIGSETLGRRRQ